MTPPILIVPGLFNSEPDHWQSHWERTLPGAERVDQTDWERPTLGDWTAGLMEAVRRRPGAILVAHSLGCALVGHLAAIRGARGIAGAFLVAPADVNRQGPAGRLLEGFSPIPRARLPFPSMVVASRDDPYVEIDRAQAFARLGLDLHRPGSGGSHQRRLRPRPLAQGTRAAARPDRPDQGHVRRLTGARGIMNWEKGWRPGPESNRGARICNPLRNHSATGPSGVNASGVGEEVGSIQEPAPLGNGHDAGVHSRVQRGFSSSKALVRKAWSRPAKVRPAAPNRAGRSVSA